jgi:hypothetical protein
MPQPEEQEAPAHTSSLGGLSNYGSADIFPQSTPFGLLNLMPVAPIMPVHPRPLAPLDAEVTDFDLMNLKGPKAG